ncbi:hypothetical protein RUM43_007072 [Polyplax serrata]|uniref:DNA polymerase alpha subunit B n=1 Tax=Polyplax serrata TaxID=468196 RepID=A0AAN8Q5M8_POLSC
MPHPWRIKIHSDVRVSSGSGIKRKYNYDTSPQGTFSPASYSPTITTPSAKYSTRKNAGDVVYRHNDDVADRSWKCKENYVAKIELDANLSIPISLYMHNCLTDFLDYWDTNIKKLGKLIRSKHSLDEEMPMNHKGVNTFVLVGRIACDGEGRINSKTVQLEGASDNASGEAVDLDMSVLQKYSIFPGQVVAVEAYNLTKDRLVVKELYSDTDINFFKPYELPRGSLNVMVASGPYTPTDSMTYEPLLDLVKEVVKQEPHVLILTGPFIEANHPVLEESVLAETTEEFFEKVIEQIMKPLEREFTSPMVYPTPQIKLKTKQTYPKLHLLPDPSIFAVEDVVFGVTSTDVLLHMSKEEISCSLEGGRLPRLAKHILQQRSFYPLSPAKDVPLDPLLMDHAKLEIAPHILIVPSDLRYFIQKVDGCVVVNPERLAKGLIGGTYARLIISPNDVVGNIVKV